MQKQHPFLHCLAVASIFVLGSQVPMIRAEDVSVPKPVSLPFVVYEDKGSANNHFISSGWMGNAGGTKMDEGCTNNPHGGRTCLRVEYSEPASWSGIVWQDPANDWGDLPGGYNLTGARKIKFWARGEKGGEVVAFKFGVLGVDKKFSDTASGDISEVKLNREWTEYTIDLAGKNLSRIKTGFVWTVAGQGGLVVFFLDDIRYE